MGGGEPREKRPTAWITGASSGIGRAVAIELEQAGWSIGAGSRDEPALRDLVSSFAQPERHAFAAVDVRRTESVAAWTATLRAATGEPDAVIQCAGWGVFRKVVETTDEEWDRTIDTNLRGFFLVTRAVLPAMLERGDGRLLYILSVAAPTAIPNNAAYNASKFGALGFVEALRAE
ncbi:MAG: SDR family oxidoreductase, partial [Candidatus Eisenbacteria bacterium]|nr:SDR family oxidoreductase [Candidatus Eisenbacteria bacterium]